MLLTPLPLSQTVTPSRTPSPLERDVLYGRPLRDVISNNPNVVEISRIDGFFVVNACFQKRLWTNRPSKISYLVPTNYLHCLMETPEVLNTRFKQHALKRRQGKQLVHRRLSC